MKGENKTLPSFVHPESTVNKGMWMVNEFFMFGIFLLCEEMIKVVSRMFVLLSMIEVFFLCERLLNKYK